MFKKKYYEIVEAIGRTENHATKIGFGKVISCCGQSISHGNIMQAALEDILKHKDETKIFSNQKKYIEGSCSVCRLYDLEGCEGGCKSNAKNTCVCAEASDPQCVLISDRTKAIKKTMAADRSILTYDSSLCTDAYNTILEILNSAGSRFSIHSHEEIPTVEEAVQKVSYDINRCFKTLAFEYEDSYIFVCISAKERLLYSKLCSFLNLSRRHLKKADSTILTEKFGYESGGIAPISVDEKIKVVLDKKIFNHASIYCGSGRRDRSIEIFSVDLAGLDRVVVTNVTD